MGYYVDMSQPASAPAARQAPVAAPETVAFSLRTFAPGWGAAVMGTGALAIALWSLARHDAGAVLAFPLATVLFWITLLFGTLVIGLTIARWIRFPADATADLQHPVKGGMSATIPGALLVIAMALGRIGAELWGTAAVRGSVIVLTLVGGALSLIFGIVFLASIFASGTTPARMITGAWFIPPVVTVIIPTALAPLIGGDGASATLDRELLAIAWATLGIGGILYLIVTAVLFFRSATAPLPPAALAPTLIIGMGPAGLIGLNLVLITEASVRHGVMTADVTGTAVGIGLVFWGFGLWWALTALTVILRGYDRVPFGLPWWGFTFPLGAWVVAGFVLAALGGIATVFWIALAGLIALIAVWIVTLVRTIIGIANRSIWAG